MDNIFMDLCFGIQIKSGLERAQIGTDKTQKSTEKYG